MAARQITVRIPEGKVIRAHGEVVSPGFSCSTDDVWVVKTLHIHKFNNLPTEPFSSHQIKFSHGSAAPAPSRLGCYCVPFPRGPDPRKPCPTSATAGSPLWCAKIASGVNLPLQPSNEKDVLQLSGRLAGDVKESRNDSPTRDLQMAADRTRPHTLCGPVVSSLFSFAARC